MVMFEIAEAPSSSGYPGSIICRFNALPRLFIKELISNYKKMFELGGRQNHLMVFNDAILHDSTKCQVSMSGCAGQRCMAASAMIGCAGKR